MIVDVKSLSLLVYQLKSSTGYDGGSIHWYNDKNNTSCLTVLERAFVPLLCWEGFYTDG